MRKITLVNVSLAVIGLFMWGCSSNPTNSDSNDGAVDTNNKQNSKSPKDLIASYLRGDVATKLVFEVDYVEGLLPSAEVEQQMIQGLTPLLDKPEGITIVHDQKLPAKGSTYAWTYDEFSAMAHDTYNLSVDDKTAKIHILFVDGHHAEDGSDGKILGVAWANIHLMLFKETIDEACGSSTILPTLKEKLCAQALVSVWTHEIGHILGLVNNGLEMVHDHQDKAHGAHDMNDDCVMYWASERSTIFKTLAERFLKGNESALGFDQSCLDDIAAIRDKK